MILLLSFFLKATTQIARQVQQERTQVADQPIGQVWEPKPIGKMKPIF